MDRQEQLHELRARILQAEEDRLRGANTHDHCRGKRSAEEGTSVH